MHQATEMAMSSMRHVHGNLVMVNRLAFHVSTAFTTAHLDFKVPLRSPCSN